jgi:hypothetical protein
MTPFVTSLEFDVRSSFHADLWHDETAGPWRVRIPGCEESDDYGRLVLPCSGAILDALRECLDAEAARGEGLRNLNVLLTSIKNSDFERLRSKYESVRWSFNKIELYFDEQRIRSWWDGTRTCWHTYDINNPMPDGQFTLKDDSVATVLPESLAVLTGLIEEVRALRDEDSILEDDRDNIVDIFCATALTVNSEDPWEGYNSFGDPLEGIGILLERVGSTAEQASELWPVVLSSDINEIVDSPERKWTAAERKRRLRLARTAVERFAAAASTTLDAETVHLFVGIANGEPGDPDCLIFDPGLCRSGTGRWWKVGDALETLLDASNAACLDAIDERFFQDGETVTIGIHTALPFIASHRGCALSEVLDGTDLGGDHTFGYVTVLDGELHWLREQSYEGGEIGSGLFLGFSDTGGTDVELVKSIYYLGGYLDGSHGELDTRRVMQLLSEVSTQPDA